MLRILSWNANTGFEKLQSQVIQPLIQDTSVTMMSCANAPNKRKRSFAAVMPSGSEHAVTSLSGAEMMKPATAEVLGGSATACQAQNPVKSSVLLAVSSASNCANGVVSDVDSNSSCQARLKSKDEAQLATMRQTISSQLNLEILLKHRELRLIDQELAKCQVALEQLRRCGEIPYPALQRPSEQLSSGKGPSVRKVTERQPARSPAPWGVVDGPYTRHYAKWLLPDPHFDGGETDLASVSTSNTPLHGRSTRGHYTDFAQMVGKTSRSQRALNGGLTAGFAEPKQKPTGPMILKRKSDGKMVKLVCPDCGRFDFGSAQGFINHCRIGHQRNFASHDAAAEGCGEAIEVGDNGEMKGAPLEVTVPLPTMATAPTTPVAAPSVPSSVSSTIHPLVRSAHLTSKQTVGKPLVKGGYVPKSERKTNKSKKRTPAQASCMQTPNLSAFVRDRGLNLDLQGAVTDAKMKIDMLEEIDDGEMELDSPLPTPNGNSRHPQVAGKKPSTKSAGSNSGIRKPSFSEARGHDGIVASISNVHIPTENSRFQHFAPLMPSPTNESTQAPSLIDDDEEIDPQSPPSSDELDESDVHFHVRDDEHPEEAHDLRDGEMPAPTTTCAQTTTSAQPARNTAPSYIQSPSSKDENLHSYIAEYANDEDQNGRKRRKIAE